MENNENKLLELGNKIKFIRKELDLTMHKLEEILDFPKNTIHRIESGKGSNPHNLISLFQFFQEKNISIDWLVDNNNKELNWKKDNNIISIDTIDSANSDDLLDKLSYVKHMINNIEEKIHKKRE